MNAPRAQYQRYLEYQPSQRKHSDRPPPKNPCHPYSLKTIENLNYRSNLGHPVGAGRKAVIGREKAAAYLAVVAGRQWETAMKLRKPRRGYSIGLSNLALFSSARTRNAVPAAASCRSLGALSQDLTYACALAISAVS